MKATLLFGLLVLGGVNLYSQSSIETTAQEQTCEVSYSFIYESNNTDTCSEVDNLFKAKNN